MSNIIPFTAGAKLPAYLQNRAALAVINSDVTNGSSYPTLSIKGKVFTLSKDNQKKILTKADDPDEVLQSINLVVIRANKNSRVFYAKAYNEDDSEGAKPTCQSSDGISPSAHVAAPQAAKCQLCPHAVWGSKAGDTGKGTACSVNTRLAIADPDNVEEPWLLRVPAGSRSNFSDACKVADSRGLVYNCVVLKVGFDPTAPSPKLTFKPIGLVSDEAYEKVSKLYASDDVLEIVGLTERRHVALPAPTPVHVEADELDAAMATKAVVAKAAKVAPVSEDEIDDIMAGLPPVGKQTKVAVDVEDAPVKPKKVPVPVAEVEDAPVKAAAKPAKVAEVTAGNSMDDLLGSLDDLLGGTDD